MKTIGSIAILMMMSFQAQNPLPACLNNLVGLWKMETLRGPIFEEWKKAGPDLLMGRSYRLKGNDTVLLEEISIKQMGNDLFYIPTVQDQNNRQPITFKLVSQADNKFIFENKEHDFPQRIIYNIISSDSVLARIEGIRNGIERHSNFPYSRVR